MGTIFEWTSPLTFGCSLIKLVWLSIRASLPLEPFLKKLDWATWQIIGYKKIVSWQNVDQSNHTTISISSNAGLLQSNFTSNMTVSFISFPRVLLGISTNFLDYFDAKFLQVSSRWRTEPKQWKFMLMTIVTDGCHYEMKTMNWYEIERFLVIRNYESPK